MTSETRFEWARQGLDYGVGCGGNCREMTSLHCQVKEMSLIRNTIMECQVCGEWESRGGLQRALLCFSLSGFSFSFLAI